MATLTASSTYDLRKSVWGNRFGDVSPSLSRMAPDSRGFHPESVKLLRYGTHCVIRAGFHVFRISHREHADMLNENLLTVSAVHAAGVPVIKPLSRRVFELDEHAVATRWVYRNQLDPLVVTDYERIAESLFSLHQLTSSEYTHKAFSSRSFRERLSARLSALDPSMPADVQQQLHRLSAEALRLCEQADEEAKVLAHGDVSIDNAVGNGCGGALLIDLDGIAAAPAEKDVADVQMSTHRFVSPGFEPFLSAYGASHLNMELVEAFSRIKEVAATTWLSTLWNVSPAARTELVHRLSTWDDTERPLWNRL